MLNLYYIVRYFNCLFTPVLITFVSLIQIPNEKRHISTFIKKTNSNIPSHSTVTGSVTARSFVLTSVLYLLQLFSINERVNLFILKKLQFYIGEHCSGRGIMQTMGSLTRDLKEEGRMLSVLFQRLQTLPPSLSGQICKPSHQSFVYIKSLLICPLVIWLFVGESTLEVSIHKKWERQWTFEYGEYEHLMLQSWN